MNSASVFAPAGLTATRNPHGSATVSWHAPCSAGDVPVLDYTLTPFDVTTGMAGFR